MGDEDLLDIIGNSKNIAKLQKHFKKMFAGIHGLILNADESFVEGFYTLHYIIFFRSGNL